MVLGVLALAIEGIGEVLVEAVAAPHTWARVSKANKRKVVTVFRGKGLVVAFQAMQAQLHNLQAAAGVLEGQQAQGETVISLWVVEVDTVEQAQYRVLFLYTAVVAVAVWGLQETLTNTTVETVLLKAATAAGVILALIPQHLIMALLVQQTQAVVVVERLALFLLGRGEQEGQEL
jgi:hypothetical protein